MKGIALILALFINIFSLNYRSHKTLVIIDNIAIKETYSIFFNILRNHNHTLDIKHYSNPKIKIRSYDEILYDNIIFIAPSLNNTFQFKIKEILDFFDIPDHNIMIIADTDVNEYISSLSAQFGVGFIEQGSNLKASSFCQKQENTFQAAITPELFTTMNIGMEIVGLPLLLDKSNDLVFPLLYGEPCLFVENKKKKVSHIGDDVVLVAGLQSRNNNRASINGLFPMCSNLFMTRNMQMDGNLSSSENYRFCEELIEWNFQELGIIKVTDIRHFRTSDNKTLSEYNVGEKIRYEVDLLTWNTKKEMFTTYLDSRLRLEFVMIDPYYRLMMFSTLNSTYFTEFKVPDKQGVYKFVLNISRRGYTFVLNETKMPVRPLAHNEFQRFHVAAYPYYACVFLSMIFLIKFLILLFKSKVDEEKIIEANIVKDKTE